MTDRELYLEFFNNFLTVEVFAEHYEITVNEALKLINKERDKEMKEMKKMKKIKLTQSDIGRFCRVFFNDVGAQDGIITQVDGSDDFRFMSLNNLTEGTQHNNGAECVALGKRVTAELSGLN